MSAYSKNTQLLRALAAQNAHTNAAVDALISKVVDLASQLAKQNELIRQSIDAIVELQSRSADCGPSIMANESIRIDKPAAAKPKQSAVRAATRARHMASK